MAHCQPISRPTGRRWRHSSDIAIRLALNSMRPSIEAIAISTRCAIDQLLEVAIEHRLMHAETLSYLLHQMPFHAKRGSTTHEDRAMRAVTPQTVRVPAGRTSLGLSASSGKFGWDNEFEAHTVDVPAFVIDKYKVTNEQYLAFLDDGGYCAPRILERGRLGVEDGTCDRAAGVLAAAATAHGFGGRCSMRFRCRWTGRCTSVTLKQAPTRAGLGARCRPKRSGNALRLARTRSSSSTTSPEIRCASIRSPSTIPS